MRNFLVKLLPVFAAVTCVDGGNAAQSEASMYASFKRVNAMPFRTAQHQGNPMVNVWAIEAATTPYRMLSIAPSQAIQFPVGALIVKEMIDPNGGELLLTVMSKQPVGYDAEHGDWWYGRLHADGSATRSDFVGKVSFCIACHDAAPGDHLFGVQADNLAP
jgi:hypothetical protein